MNKQQFLDKLKSKISILNDEEIEDILNEYAGYIDEKVAEGKTEKEAVKELGNVNEIAADLLDAYKVKTTSQDNENIIERAVNWLTSFVEMLVDKIKGQSFTDIIKFLILICMIFLIILICKIPFIIVRDAGVGIFRRLGNIGDFIAYIWTTIIEFSYLIIAIIAFVTIVKKEFLKDMSKKEAKPKTVSEVKVDNKKAVKVKKETKDPKYNVPNQGFFNNLANFIVKCLVLFLKFIACCILLGMAGYIIGITVGIVVTAFVFIKTLKFIGIFVILIGLLSIGVAFCEVLFNFVVNRKTNFKKIFITIIFSLLALGGGIGLTSMQLAKMSFKKTDANTTKEVAYKMDKDLLIKDFDEEDFIIDENEKDIKVIYKYNDKFIKIRQGQSKEIFINNYDYIVDNRVIYKYVINGLKNNIFYYDFGNGSMKVYVNEKNYDILKNNYDKYMEEQIAIEEDLDCDCDCDCDFE